MHLLPRSSRWSQRLVVWGALIVVWEAIGIATGPFFLPRFSAVCYEIITFFRNDDLLILLGSLRQMGIGFGLTAVIGIPIGLSIGASRVINAAISPYFNALLILPLEALLPLIIIVAGTQFTFRVAVVFLFSIHYIVINVAAGIRAVSPALLEMANSFGASRFHLYTQIYLPSTLPYVFTGLRLGLGSAFKGMILAELWIVAGTGKLIVDLGADHRLAELFALIVVVVAFGMCCTRVLRWIEQRTSKWDSAHDAVTGSRHFSHQQGHVVRFASFMLFFLVWQWYGSQPNTLAVAAPLELLPVLNTSIHSGEFWNALLGFLITAGLGYAVAVAVGVPLGILIAMSQWAKHTLDPILDVLNVAPLTLFIPMFALYFGFGLTSQIMLVVLWTLFVVVFSTSAGIRNASPELQEMGVAYQATRLNMLRTIILPAALPNIMTGLRIGMGRALRGAIAAEMLLSVNNMGKFIKNAGSLFQIPKMTFGILVVVVTGLILVYSVEIFPKLINSRFNKRDLINTLAKKS